MANPVPHSLHDLYDLGDQIAEFVERPWQPLAYLFYNRFQRRDKSRDPLAYRANDLSYDLDDRADDEDDWCKNGVADHYRTPPLFRAHDILQARYLLPHIGHPEGIDRFDTIIAPICKAFVLGAKTQFRLTMLQDTHAVSNRDYGDSGITVGLRDYGDSAPNSPVRD